MARNPSSSLLVSLTRLLLLIVPLLMGIALFELLVRLTGFDVNPNPNWRYHPVLGWSQEPNGRFDYLKDAIPDPDMNAIFRDAASAT